MSGVCCITRELKDVSVLVNLSEIETTTDVEVDVKVDYGQIITEFENLVAMGYARTAALEILAKEGIGIEVE